MRAQRRKPWIVAFAAIVATAALAVADGSARQTVEAQVQKILARLQDPAFKAESREAQIRQIEAIINQVFDYTELSKRTLGKDWRAFSPAQQKEFAELFGKLLEKVYADRVLAYTSERIDFGGETELREGQVEVKSEIVTADGRRIPLDYRLLLQDGRWRVYDVVIEGISLVQNYRSQFREILAKQSPEEVMRFMREKTAN
jgi:phospholipid transport system substrate-binding protein